MHVRRIAEVLVKTTKANAEKDLIIVREDFLPFRSYTNDSRVRGYFDEAQKAHSELQHKSESELDEEIDTLGDCKELFMKNSHTFRGLGTTKLVACVGLYEVTNLRFQALRKSLRSDEPRTYFELLEEIVQPLLIIHLSLLEEHLTKDFISLLTYRESNGFVKPEDIERVSGVMRSLLRRYPELGQKSEDGPGLGSSEVFGGDVDIKLSSTKRSPLEILGEIERVTEDFNKKKQESETKLAQLHKELGESLK